MMIKDTTPIDNSSIPLNPGLTIDNTAANLVPSNQDTTVQVNTGAASQRSLAVANPAAVAVTQQVVPTVAVTQQVVSQVAAAPQATYGVQNAPPQTTYRANAAPPPAPVNNFGAPSTTQQFASYSNGFTKKRVSFNLDINGKSN